MKIQTLIESDHVYLDLEAVNLAEALGFLADLMATDVGLPSEEIAHGLSEREELGSTAIGGGFAIPHCKLNGLSGIVIALARFRNPIHFEPSGTEDVRFVFVVLSPPDRPALHLQALSQIARTLKSDEIRTRLLEAEDQAEIVEIVKKATDGGNL